MKNKDGNLIFEQQPYIVGYASAVGKKEGEGPLRETFDRIIHDSYVGKDTFEQAESELLNVAVRLALEKSSMTPSDVDIACCGDLLNQCVASSFAMRPFGIPFAGVYGACSTMALSMIIAGTAVESGAAEKAVCAVSSHYCTAERQYRFPLEYGSQRPPTAQWTVTGAGACVISSDRSLKNEAKRSQADSVRTTNMNEKSDKESNTDQHELQNGVEKPRICAARIGKIVDYNITDQNNMGAAMAPAVVKIGT